MNNCIICDKESGFGMVCKECKEALTYHKNSYIAKKALTETTDYDELMFSVLYNAEQIDLLIKEDQEGISPSDEETLIKDIKNVYEEFRDNDDNNNWLFQKEGRFENYMKFVERKIHKKMEELKNGK